MYPSNIVDTSTFYTDRVTNNVTLTDDNEIKIYPKTSAENVSYTHSRKPTLRNVKQFLDDLNTNLRAGSNSDGGPANNIVVANSNSGRYYVTGVPITSGVVGTSLTCCNNPSGSENVSGIYFDASSGVLFGAAWNDFAEFRNCDAKAGQVVCESGDGSLKVSQKRLQSAPAVVSDTYGMVIGN